MWFWDLLFLYCCVLFRAGRCKWLGREPSHHIERHVLPSGNIQRTFSCSLLLNFLMYAAVLGVLMYFVLAQLFSFASCLVFCFVCDLYQWYDIYDIMLWRRPGWVLICRCEVCRMVLDLDLLRSELVDWVWCLCVFWFYSDVVLRFVVPVLLCFVPCRAM